MRDTKSVITSLRDRISGDGYTVFTGRKIDPEQDPLPVVTIHYHNDGDQQATTRPRPIDELSLVVEYWSITKTDDPMLELLEEVADFESSIIKKKSNRSDSRDDLEGSAHNVTRKKTTIWQPDKWSNVAVIQVVVAITY